MASYVALSNTGANFGDRSLTNVGDIAIDSISPDGTDINVALSDNSATALTMKQGSDAYLILDTANSSESVSVGTGISGTAISIGHTTSETTVNDNLTVTGTAEAASYKGTVLKALTAYATVVGASSTAENATNKTLVVPANTLVLGDRIQIRYMGNFTAAATPAMSIKVKVTDDDSHTYTVFTNTNTSTASSGVNSGVINLSFLVAGATGRMDYFATGFTGAGMTADGGVYKELDTTTAITVSVTCQFDASHSSNTFTLRELSAVRDSIN
jgi:hypothetical protein